MKSLEIFFDSHKSEQTNGLAYDAVKRFYKNDTDNNFWNDPDSSYIHRHVETREESRKIYVEIYDFMDENYHMVIYSVNNGDAEEIKKFYENLISKLNELYNIK